MRLVSWNVQHLEVYTEVEVPAEEHFAKALTDLNPDVLFLQEVDEYNARSGSISHTGLAATTLEAGNHRFVATPEAPGNYGIAVISRVPVIEWRELRLPAAPLGQRLTFMEGGEPRRYYVPDHSRAALAATLVNGWTVVNTHCSFVPAMAQLHALTVWRWARAIARRHGSKLVVGGDLNFSRTAWLRRFGAVPLAGSATFPAWEPVRQIDHLLTGSDQAHVPTLQVAARREISDHLPVWSEL